MQAKKWGDGYHVEIGFDMEDSDWDHPLILGADGVSLEETLDLFRRVGLKAEQTGDIDLISNCFRDIGFGCKGTEIGAAMSSFEGGYYGRYYSDGSGELISAGKFIGGALSLYDGRDGQFHYDPRYDKMYYEGEFDEISDEEFEKFKKKMDELGKPISPPQP